MRCVVNVLLTTWAEPASAASTSPRANAVTSRRLPPGWIAGASGANAAAGEVTGRSSSTSTRTAFAAWRAWNCVSATTSASTSPTQRVVSPTAMNTGQSLTTRPT